MKAQLDACWRAFKAACVILHTGGIVWQPDQRSDIFIEHLIRLAETMRIASRLKHAVFDLLFQAKSDLFQSAQRMPIRYLKIAYVLQNAALFKEAAIHVISRWPCAEKEAIEEAMSCGSLLRFIEEKHEKLVRCVDMVHLRISRLEVVSRNYAGKLDAEALLATSLFRTNFSHRTKISCTSCEHEPGKGCTSGLVDLWLGFKMGEPRAFSDEEIKTSFVGSGIASKMNNAKLAAYTNELTSAAAKILDEDLLNSKLRARPSLELKHRFLTGIKIKDAELPWLRPILGKRRRDLEETP